MRCFNPRAHEGRDAVRELLTRPTIEFQSTRLRGARQVPHRLRHCRHRVSIHAPTRGATQRVRDFNKAEEFQSTRPRGARRQNLINKCPACSRFNPRAHEGRDRTPPAPSCLSTVSIHAPTRGATRSRSTWAPMPSEFQSTRPRGARRRLVYGTLAEETFQSTRPRGARPESSKRRA